MGGILTMLTILDHQNSSDDKSWGSSGYYECVCMFIE